jgi:hypothetical protein
LRDGKLQQPYTLLRSLSSVEESISWLTSDSRVLLENLIVSQLVKKLLAFNGTQMFITVFIKVPVPRQMKPVHNPSPISLKSTLIVCSHLRSNFSNCFFFSGFPTEFCVYVHLSHVCYVIFSSHHLWFHRPNIWWRLQIMELPITYFSPAFWYFLPLRSEYSLQHALLKTPSDTVLPEPEIKFHTDCNLLGRNAM